MRALSFLVAPLIPLSVAIACGGEFQATDGRSSGGSEDDAGSGAGGSGSTGAGGGGATTTGGRSGAGGGGATTTGGSGSGAGGQPPGAGGRPNPGGSPSAGGAVVCCGAEPTCNTGELQLPYGSECPVGYTCRDVKVCCSAITCATPDANCDAIPVCDPGDQQYSGTCPQGATCYERSMCGMTIQCSHQVPAVDAGGTACNPDNEPNRQYESYDPKECAVIAFPCPSGTTFFSNECGCGCEQPSYCQEYVDCSLTAPPFISIPLPPDLCTDDTACPYTERIFVAF